MVKPTFVEIGESQGREDVNENKVYKYLVKGLQSNYYFETKDNKPRRFNQSPFSNMIWDNYKEVVINDKVFALPTNMEDCNQGCRCLTICKLLREA